MGRKEENDAILEYMHLALPCVVTGMIVESDGKTQELTGMNFRPNKVTILNDIASKLRQSPAEGTNQLLVRLITNTNVEIQLRVDPTNFLVIASER